MDNHKVFVFEPSRDRSLKRRRVEQSGPDSSWALREKTFKEIWGQQRSIIDEVLHGANSDTLNQVVDFLNDTSSSVNDAPLRCGFILGDLDSTVHSSFFEQLSDLLPTRGGRKYVQLAASECPNLKALLKTLIRKATSTHDNSEDELTNGITSSHGRKVLDYDLQILEDYVRRANLQQVVVTFQDGEAFEGQVIGEALELMSLSLSRIPFALLFGVATSIENFQDKLPRTTLRLIESQQFDVAQSEVVLESVFCRTVAAPTAIVRLGPMLSRLILDRHSEQIVSIEDFADALQYAYMTHFFANPLTVFLNDELRFDEESSEHFESLRNLPSFRQFAESRLQSGESVDAIRSWLDSDRSLFELVRTELKSARETISEICMAMDVLATCRQITLRQAQISRSSLYLKALQNELLGSAAAREALLAVKRAPSDQLNELISTLVPLLKPDSREELLDMDSRLQQLVRSAGSEVLRSEHDVRNETLRTTIVAQKVELSRHKENLSKNDATYSKILTDFHDWLESYFNHSFIDTDTLFLRELFIYDQRGPHRAAFMPKTRFAVERALSSPHDYLGCDCCAPDEEEANAEIALKASHPATAILYQLYLESGPFVNASDLWSAFSAILEAEEEPHEKESMALFERSLAELKHLGFIKSTRKKTDHVAKVTWKGL